MLVASPASDGADLFSRLPGDLVTRLLDGDLPTKPALRLASTCRRLRNIVHRAVVTRGRRAGADDSDLRRGDWLMCCCLAAAKAAVPCVSILPAANKASLWDNGASWEAACEELLTEHGLGLVDDVAVAKKMTEFSYALTFPRCNILGSECVGATVRADAQPGTFLGEKVVIDLEYLHFDEPMVVEERLVRTRIQITKPAITVHVESQRAGAKMARPAAGG